MPLGTTLERRVLAVALALSLGACAAPSTQAFGARPARTRASAAPTAETPREPPPPDEVAAAGTPEPLLPRGEAWDPGPIACDVTTTSFSGDVSLRPGGASFASLNEAGVSVALARTSGETSGRVSVAASGVHLSLVLPEPALYLRSATVFAGFLTPRAEVSLGFLGAGRAGAAGVTLDLSDLFDEPTRFETIVPCGRLALGPHRFAVSNLRSEGGGATRAATGTIMGPAELSLAPGRAPVAKLKKGVTLSATPLERRPGAVRVWIEEPRFVGVAWVASDRFDAFGIGGVRGEGARGIGMSGHIHWRGCARNLALWGTTGDELVPIGELTPEAAFVVGEPVDRDHLAIELRAEWLLVNRGAKIVVERAALEACTKPAGS